MHYRNMPRRVQQRIRDFFLLVCSHVGVSHVSAVQSALPSFMLRDLKIQMQHQRVFDVPALRCISFFPLKVPHALLQRPLPPRARRHCVPYAITAGA